jgi:tetratricopeptide (TPR) repeat protein
MSIWSAEIKEIERLYESLKGQLPDLEKELERLIKTDDENIVLVYSRRCLEVIITDLCENELNRPRKTEPLKGIIDKLGHEEKVPSHIIASMDGLNSLSTFGAHPKDFDPEQVKPVLSNLAVVIRWYLKYKDSQSIRKAKPIADIAIEAQAGESQTIRKVLTGEDKTIHIESVESQTIYNVKSEKKDKIKPVGVPVKIIQKRAKSLILLLAGLILIAVIIAYPKIFKRERFEQLRSSDKRISVAVMPFQNMTNDTSWNIWQDGIQDMLINSLSNSEDLKVRQTESINNLIRSKGLTSYATITPSLASSISQKLDADFFVNGNIKQAETTIRVYAQIIDSKSEEVIKSFQVEGFSYKKMIFQIIDSLASEVKNFLIVSKLEKEVPLKDIRETIYTDSPEAYRYYIYGMNAFEKLDYATSIKMFSQSFAIDSTFGSAAFFLSIAYRNLRFFEEGKKLCLLIYKHKDQQPMQRRIMIDWLYASYFETPQQEIKYCKQFLELDDQSPSVWFIYGNCYLNLQQYLKAIPKYEKSLEIYSKWGIKPMYVYNYTYPGLIYHGIGNYKKEKKLYQKAEQDFPDDPALIYSQAVLSLTKENNTAADEYIDKYISVRKENSDPEASIMTGLAGIYSSAGIMDKAEEYYRKALTLEPENPERLNSLAWFLIDNDRNINEGLELIEKALESTPDYYNYLDTKGWGLYKKGKTEEALENIQKAWDLRPVYNHEIFLHLEEVKKAVGH